METTKIMFAKIREPEIKSEPTKRCPHCGRELPLSDFHNDRSTKSGKTSWCKSCQREAWRLRDRMKRQALSSALQHKMDVDLKFLSAEMIINELKSRGYSGTVSYSETVMRTIKF